MMSMNRATLVGRAGGDPEMRKLKSGEDVALFSLATTERFTRRDSTAGQSTEWHGVVAYGGAADVVRKRVRKGDAVLVEGRIATRSWKDRQGNERRTTEIVVSWPRGQINVLAPRGRSPNGGDDDPSGGTAAGVAAGHADDAAEAGDAVAATAQDVARPAGDGAHPGADAESADETAATAATPVGKGEAVGGSDETAAADTSPAAEKTGEAACGADAAGTEAGGTGNEDGCGEVGAAEAAPTTQVAESAQTAAPPDSGGDSGTRDPVQGS